MTALADRITPLRRAGLSKAAIAAILDTTQEEVNENLVTPSDEIDSTWADLTPATNYAHAGGNYHNASYRIVNDVVELRGRLTKTGQIGTDTVFTLPAAARDNKTHNFIVPCGPGTNTHAELSIALTTGVATVTPSATITDSGDYLDLDGVFFSLL